MHFMKDPSSGRRVSRPNPAAQRKVQPVPELQIVDQKVWDAVQHRLGNIRAEYGADRTERPRYWEQRRPQHVLTGKVVCGCCGGAFSAVGKDYLACTTARRQGICANAGSIKRPILEAVVLDALRADLMAPEPVAAFVEEFTAEWNRLQAGLSAGREAEARELGEVRRKLDRMTESIADGGCGHRPACSRRSTSLKHDRSNWSAPWPARKRARRVCIPT